MHRALCGTGSGMLVVSLLVALVLTSVDPLWAGQHLMLLAACAWAQEAALVLGASLLAAGLVVARLAPPPVPQLDPRLDPPTDWFA